MRAEASASTRGALAGFLRLPPVVFTAAPVITHGLQLHRFSRETRKFKQRGRYWLGLHSMRTRWPGFAIVWQVTAAGRTCPCPGLAARLAWAGG